MKIIFNNLLFCGIITFASLAQANESHVLVNFGHKVTQYKITTQYKNKEPHVTVKSSRTEKSTQLSTENSKYLLKKIKELIATPSNKRELCPRQYILTTFNKKAVVGCIASPTPAAVRSKKLVNTLTMAELL
ncbi:MAG: hypothetical protein CL677_00160 [Bdellovibrionaceae bacterium]|nr:hypothetical protein [Pseudobdellovibrionaceae bacterium]|tara:strand:+ start:141 stop:536 length:396 start_codon:yes stop_codon:yes gene_type:complete